MSVIDNPASFREEAKYQRACARCGAAGGFHAHHVVDKALLERLGAPLYDTRNALRLCEGLDGNRCHMQFENRRVTVKLSMLTDDNIEFAYEVLGDSAFDYLTREYEDDGDPRVRRP